MYFLLSLCFFFIAGSLYGASRRYESTQPAIALIAIVCVILGFIFLGIPLFSI